MKQGSWRSQGGRTRNGPRHLRRPPGPAQTCLTSTKTSSAFFFQSPCIGTEKHAYYIGRMCSLSFLLDTSLLNHLQSHSFQLPLSFLTCKLQVPLSSRSMPESSYATANSRRVACYSQTASVLNLLARTHCLMCFACDSWGVLKFPAALIVPRLQLNPRHGGNPATRSDPSYQRMSHNAQREWSTAARRTASPPQAFCAVRAGRWAATAPRAATAATPTTALVLL